MSARSIIPDKILIGNSTQNKLDFVRWCSNGGTTLFHGGPSHKLTKWLFKLNLSPSYTFTRWYLLRKNAFLNRKKKPFFKVNSTPNVGLEITTWDQESQVPPTDPVRHPEKRNFLYTRVSNVWEHLGLKLQEDEKKLKKWSCL